MKNIESIKEKTEWVEYTRQGITKSSVLTGVARVSNILFKL